MLATIQSVVAAGTGMKLQEIDSALAEWNNRLAAIAKNLLELQADSTYQLLTGSGGVEKLALTGVTAERVEPSLGAMLTIFQHFGLLHEVIDRASTLRAGLPAMFGGEAKAAEIRRLLGERTIRLPALDVPMDQKTLLSGVARAECFSPDELLAIMSRTFVAARDAVLRVDEAWNEMAAAVEGADAKLARFGVGAEVLGARGAAERARAEAILAGLRGQVGCDPFGALEEFAAGLEPVLGRLAGLAAEAEALHEQMREAWVQVEALGAAHREAEEAGAEARARIVGADGGPLPASAEKQEEFRAWLERLERRRAEGLVEAVAVGLRNLRRALDTCLAEERASLAASRGMLDLRAELRGRLEALRAKARAYGVAEDGLVAGAAGAAEALLYARPTDLERAGAAVREYEKRVSGARRVGLAREAGPR